VNPRLLLDTHAFLWWLDGDRRLPLRVRRRIGDETNVILVSAASAWEITTKARLGKLPGAMAVAADVAGAIASQGFSALEISILHAQRAGNLPGDHRDPFDRMLIAQAQLEDVPLVSNDGVFDGFSVNRVW
jgi:PIN domain nuclease of toxin-antitoxin system